MMSCCATLPREDAVVLPAFDILVPATPAPLFPAEPGAAPLVERGAAPLVERGAAPPVEPGVAVPAEPVLRRAAWVERILSFTRFVLVGSASTALTSALFVLLGLWMPATLANTIATVVTTVGANQAHARWTFRSGRRGAGMHLRAGLSVAITYPVTTIALLTLEQVQPGAAAWLELAVLLGSSAVAGLLRYMLLLIGVFPDSPASFRAEPATAR
jgi:putative flippase GtrA